MRIVLSACRRNIGWSKIFRPLALTWPLDNAGDATFFYSKCLLPIGPISEYSTSSTLHPRTACTSLYTHKGSVALLLSLESYMRTHMINSLAPACPWIGSPFDRRRSTRVIRQHTRSLRLVHFISWHTFFRRTTINSTSSQYTPDTDVR